MKRLWLLSLLLTLAWGLPGCASKPTFSTKLAKPPATDLVAGSGRICYVGSDGGCYAVDEQGKSAWTFAPEPLSKRYRPALKDDLLSLVSERGRVYTLDLKSGKQLWRFEAPGAVGPAFVGDHYLAVQAQNSLYLLDSKTGNRLKRTSLGGFSPIDIAPCAVGSYLFVARSGPPPSDEYAEKNGAVMAYLCPGLSQQWIRPTGLGSGLAADDDVVVYLHSVPHSRGASTTVETYDRKTGKPLWSGYRPAAPKKDSVQAALPAFSQGLVLLTMYSGLDGFVSAVKANSDRLEEAWQVQLPINPSGGLACSPPLVFRDTVVVGDENHVLAYAVDTGKKQWWVDELEGKVRTAPTFLGDTVYWATDKGQLYSLKR